MSARKRTRTRARRATPRPRGARTAAPIRAAAARAVERVLSSPDAFALLIDRLEAGGWRVERRPPPLAGEVREVPPLASLDRER
jgi:hypothetical protein